MNDPIWSDEPETPHGQLIPGPDDLAFRPARLLTPGLALFLAAAAVGFLGLAIAGVADSGRLAGAVFVALMAVAYGIFALLVTLPRLRRIMKGGTPPLRFTPDGLVAPKSAHTLKTVLIPYEKLLSAAALGQGRGALLAIDTPWRVYTYPLRAFADPDAAARAAALLKARVTARADGVRRWEEIERRHAAAARLSAARPFGTYALLAALCAGFAANQVRGGPLPGDSPFVQVDLGANAPLLVQNGQYYRLVTANLLHADGFTFACTAFALLLFGVRVEREIGLARFLALVCGAGLASQGAVWAETLLGMPRLAIAGFSGVALGLFGAQIALNRRFGAQLPGLYRFSSRAWWWLPALLLPTFSMVTMSWTGWLGGFAAGLALGAFLCSDQDNAGAPPPLAPGAAMLMAALCGLWLAAAAQGIARATDPAATMADHVALEQAVQNMPAPQPEMDNDLAWSVAVDPRAADGELGAAGKIVQRALDALKKDPARDHGNVDDTLATVEFRRGEIAGALDLEGPLASRGEPYASQMTRFLDAYVIRHGGPRLVGGDAVPTASLRPNGDSWTWEVTLPAPPPKGAELFLLVRKRDRLAGLLHISLGAKVAHQTGALDLPADSVPGLQLAQFDATSCNCAPKMETYEARFHALDPDVAALPGPEK